MKSSLRDPRWIHVCFLLGLALSGVMVFRSQVAGDQLELLTRGWLFAVDGEWIPFGVKTSTGGMHPGGLLSLLVGAPLVVWRHHLAPTILVFLSHIAAYLILDRLVRKTLGPETRVLLAIFYWLNPWRILYSGFLWNPNYLFLCGAFHLLTAYGLRERGRFGLSLLHVVALGLALQINLSALSLVFASGLLWWKGYLRVRWSGVASGALLVLLSLLPWLGAVLADPALLPRGEGFAGRGLVTVYPVVQGILNWLRYPAIAVSGSMACLDFSEFGGPSHARMEEVLAGGRLVLIVLTLPVAAWANWRVWRHRLRFWRVRYQPEAGGRAWLKGAVRLSLVATLLSCGLSPISISSWSLLPQFHMTILPMVLAGSVLLRSGRRATGRRVVRLTAVVFLVLSSALAVGSPRYRCGEPNCGIRSVTMPKLRSDHRMFDDLGIRETCPLVVNEPGGWWPDILPDDAAPPVG